MLNKFKSALGSPNKARAMLAGQDINGLVNPTPDLGFNHISVGVDAFKGTPYPYLMPGCP